MPSAPSLSISVFGVRLIRHDFQEAFIAEDAADIFGRSSTCPVDALCIFGRVIKCFKILDHDRVAPAIAEIIKVGEICSSFDVAKANVTKVKDARIVVDRVFCKKLGITISQAADPEFVEMIVPSVECSLDHKVQLFEIPVRRQNKSTPDLRLDLVQGNSNLYCVDGFEHAPCEQEGSKSVKPTLTTGTPRGGRMALSRLSGACRGHPPDWDSEATGLVGEIVGDA